MNKYNDIEKRLQAIEHRNHKVELDKAWETSWIRKSIIILNTYVIIGFFMWYIDIDNPAVNAIIPTVGFYLSTLTLPFVKKWWIMKLH